MLNNSPLASLECAAFSSYAEISPSCLKEDMIAFLDGNPEHLGKQLRPKHVMGFSEKTIPGRKTTNP
ncbi:hypothetical protein J4401_01220 [Candidatus Woesearchaeota archaeon]|nr:hypothetical protein [Candidatus Woesearchaeota archaeon]